MPKKQEKLYFSKTELDGRCISMLLTEKEILKASERALDEKNAEFVGDNMIGSCWPIQKPPSCSLWNRIMGRCDCKE